MIDNIIKKLKAAGILLTTFLLCLLSLSTCGEGNKVDNKDSAKIVENEAGIPGYNDKRAAELIQLYETNGQLSKVEVNEGAEICISLIKIMTRELKDSDDLEATFGSFENKYKGVGLFYIIYENSELVDDHLIQQLKKADEEMSAILGIDS